jgi:predicted CoA-binding protein
MSIDGQSDDSIRAILTGTRRIAVVGASDKPWRPSHGVFGFLLARGYDATPVNPLIAGRAIHGRTVVARLEDAAPLEMVDISVPRPTPAPRWMRRSVSAPARSGRSRVLWTGAGFGRAAGITVVMDRCPVIEVRRLGLARH